VIVIEKEACSHFLETEKILSIGIENVTCGKSTSSFILTFGPARFQTNYDFGRVKDACQPNDGSEF
jgi:hypothetical protein